MTSPERWDTSDWILIRCVYQFRQRPHAEEPIVLCVAVAAIKDGLSRRAAAKRFGVSVSSAIRWVALEKETGAVSHRPMGGDRNAKLGKHREFLLDLIKAEPDLTLQEIRQRLARRKIKVGYGSVWR